MYLVAGAVGKWKVVWAFHLFHSLFAGTGLSIPHQGCPLFPLPFVLHRAHVVQRRMQPFPVLPVQPVQHFVFGLLPSLKALPVQAFHFERSEQRLAAGAVPTVAFPAHRRLDPILPQQVLERFSGLLATPVTVKEQPGLWRETTPE